MASSLGEEAARWCIILLAVERDSSLVLVVEPARSAGVCDIVWCCDWARAGGRFI